MRLRPRAPDQRGSVLFEIVARVKKEADLAYVQRQMLDTVKQFRGKAGADESWKR